MSMNDSETTPIDTPIDIDAYLITIESKLRSQFSSLELTKHLATASTKSQAPNTRTTPNSDSDSDNEFAVPAEDPRHEFLRYLPVAFHRLSKPIKLRTLIALTCLEPDPSHDGERLLWEVLDMADGDEDEWVRIFAGIVRGKMYRLRGKEGDKMLNKSVESTIKEVMSYASDVERIADELEGDTEEEGTISKREELLLSDRALFFVPVKYSLLDEDMVKEVMPECFQNLHFSVRHDAQVLKFDQNIEEKKAEEEIREMEIQMNFTEQEKEKTVQASLGGAAMEPPKKKINTSQCNLFLQTRRPGRGGQVGGRGARGRSAAGRGRGSMAPLGRSLATPNSFNRTSLSAAAKRSQAARSKTKMIDDDADVDPDDVDDHDRNERELKMEQESRVSARKRKLLEAAARSGLKTKKATRGLDHTVGRKPTPAVRNNRMSMMGRGNGAMKPSTRPGQRQSLNGRGHAMQPPVIQPPPVQQQQPPRSPVQNHQPPPVPEQNQDWRQLLENRSNKVTAEDRDRIEKFFISQSNPTPEQSLYKVKLHEEKKPMQDGSLLKETLYLELDYNSFKYKMLKKTKKK